MSITLEELARFIEENEGRWELDPARQGIIDSVMEQCEGYAEKFGGHIFCDFDSVIGVYDIEVRVKSFRLEGKSEIADFISLLDHARLVGASMLDEPDGQEYVSLDISLTDVAKLADKED